MTLYFAALLRWFRALIFVQSFCNKKADSSKIILIILPVGGVIIKFGFKRPRGSKC